MEKPSPLEDELSAEDLSGRLRIRSLREKEWLLCMPPSGEREYLENFYPSPNSSPVAPGSFESSFEYFSF